MLQTVLLLTPPFTQLNTPYPATAYLKGFLNAQARAGLSVAAHQADLGIEVILDLFSGKNLRAVFAGLEAGEVALSDNSYRICRMQSRYVHTIEPIIRFLQNRNPTLAHRICDRTYLPEASRFAGLDELDWAFGTMGLHDKARHLATLYLEDLGDLIQEAVDPHFGFSRYAERLGRSATHFDELHEALQAPPTLITTLLLSRLQAHLDRVRPEVVCLTVPFPGNLFGALSCGRFLKQHYPHIRVVMGGGYANTELRSLREPRLFDYVDFVSLDDGEAPLLTLLDHLAGGRPLGAVKRVFARVAGEVVYHNGAREKDVPQRETGTPDYRELPLSDYLSVIEVINPMHRLWSDGRWNKLTLAHGCYWGKCSFCDITLDYIKRYEPVTAELLCDRIEELCAQTGQTGFHFVDEAAPPALMRDLALELIRRNLAITWWTNIRFEVSFTADLCRLLKASGCIAVSGGLEVASDRLLDRMRKGVTVAQVARVADAFTQAGIMVHAYLMYGFPTQTTQETIDSLEMVRQLFQNGVVQSGFWHRFAMTAHSPVGIEPEAYGVQRLGAPGAQAGKPLFADNDLDHADPSGTDHDRFAEGLRKALFNYMHGLCFDFPLQRWFDFAVPVTSIPPRYIEKAVRQRTDSPRRPHALVVWLGGQPSLEVFELAAKAPEKPVMMAELEFYDGQGHWLLETELALGEWLTTLLPALSTAAPIPMSRQQLSQSFAEAGLGDFTAFERSAAWLTLLANGMVVV